MKKWVRHQMLVKSFVKSIVVLLQKVGRQGVDGLTTMC